MTLLEVGLLLKATDRMSSVVRGATRLASADLKGMASKARELAGRMEGTGRSSLAGGLVMAGALSAPIRAFATLEDASTRLRTAMTGAGGVLDERFDAVNQLAVKLGNKLPGTTKDFAAMMETLVRQGVPAEAILGGIGEATADLAVLLGQPYDETAKFAAKLREATGVASSDMLSFMDTIQRTANLGVSTDEMAMAFGRSAGALKQADLQGLGAAKSLSALFTILIKTGMSGETAGTNIAAVFNAFQSDSKMKKANGMLREFGIQLDMVDQATGQFRGVENMVAELDKLQALNPAELQRVLEAVFGPGQDAQIVATLIKGGIGGYNDVVDRMADQATLQARVNEQLGTLSAQWEASTGTWENAMAAWAGAASPQLSWAAQRFGEAAEALQGFTAAHPALAQAAFIAAAGISAVLVAIGLLGLASGAGLRSVANITEAMDKLKKPAAAMQARVSGSLGLLRESWYRTADAIVRRGGVMETLKFQMLRAQLGAESLAGGLKSGLLGAFRAVALGARGLALALVSNPIGAVIAGVVAIGALLIYKYWDPIKAFFAGLWEGLKEGVATIGEAFEPLTSSAVELWTALEEAFAPLGPMFDSLMRALDPVWRMFGQLGQAISGLWDWVMRLISPVQSTARELEGARQAGLSVGRVISGVLKGALKIILAPIKLFIDHWTWVAEGIGEFIAWVDKIPSGVGPAFDFIVDWAAGLPARFYEAGKNIVTSIVNGIKSKIQDAVQAMEDLASKMRAYLPFSPAKVGPFKDLHQVRIVETIAGAMEASPLVDRMRRVVAAAMTAASIGTASLPAIAVVAPPPPPAARLRDEGAPAAGGAVIHFSPTINVEGGGDAAETRRAVSEALKHSERDLERMLERIEARRQRRDY